jgi:putative copper resistance protein D
MENVLVIIHLLAACIWVGGSIALVVAGVPAIRTLEGEPRGKAMKELGLRWRPLGYSALLVLGVTGVALAGHDWNEGRSPFHTVLWVKVGLSVALVGASYLHNFVYGPRLQKEIREGRPQKTRPTLVVVGWTSLALTITVPILGAVLANLAS